MRSYLSDTVRLVYAENPGAFLGLGGDLPPQARWLLLVVVNTVVALGIGVFVLFQTSMSPLKTLACAVARWSDRQPDRSRAVRRFGDRLHEPGDRPLADRHLQRGGRGDHGRLRAAPAPERSLSCAGRRRGAATRLTVAPGLPCLTARHPPASAAFVMGRLSPMPRGCVRSFVRVLRRA